MNWFERHLNWTFVLGYAGACLLSFLAGFTMATDPNVSVGAVEAVSLLIGVTAICIVGGIVLRKKGRSLWWLFLAGCFSPLWLSNKREVVEEKESDSIYISKLKDEEK